MASYRGIAASVWLAVIAWLALAGGARAGDPVSDLPAVSDRPQPLVEQSPRSEADNDRVAAAALAMQARLLTRREDQAGALRKYQRAWRLDPAQPALLREIVSLAFELDRNGEAARHAVIAAEHLPEDAVLLRRLANYLTQQRQWKRALALYEKSLELRPAAPAGRPLDLAEVTVYFELGRLYFLTDEFAKSAEAFAKVQAALDDPNSPLTAQARQVLVGKGGRTYGLWAEAFLAARRWAEAEALFVQANELEPKPADLAFNRARVAHGKGDSAAALARLDEYFAAKTSSAGLEPYELLAELVAAAAADPEQARKLTTERLERLHQADSANAPLAGALAERYFQAGRLDDAERLLAPLPSQRATGETYRRLVEIYRRQNKPQELVKVLSSLAATSGSLEVLGDAGRALAADQPLVASLIAIAHERRKEPADPTTGGTLLAAALLARDAKDFTEADELFAAWLEQAKSGQGEATGQGETLVRWGMAMLAADEHERAVRAFRRVLDERLLPSGEASVHAYLAGGLEMSGHTDDALAAARRAAELSPSNATLAGRAGWVLAHARRWDEARQAYMQVVQQFDPQHKDVATREAVRMARMALASVELARDDFPAAAEWLEQVLDEFPEDPGASNDLGYLWADRSLHLHRALAMIQRAIAADPENLAYRDSLGWALYRLGRFAEAEPELAKAAADKDADGVVLDHWGDCLSKLSRPAEAQSAWRRAEAAFLKAGQTKALAAVREKLRS